MENTNQSNINTWENILYNSQDYTFYSKDLIANLKNEFSKEYKRIRNDFSSIFYKEDTERTINDFIEDIPEKFKKLKLFIQPFKDRYFSCIITDEEVDLLASHEHYKWVNEMFSDGWQYEEALDAGAKVHPDLIHFPNLNKTRQRFYRELIYTIPVIFIRCGFEISKPIEQGFRKEDMLENLARAIHARYRNLMSEMDEKSRTDSVYEKLYIVNNNNRKYFSAEYEQLPEDIKSSNFDSAYHIATKLLSIGYAIEKAEKNTEHVLLYLSKTDIETMAKLEHERWSWEKRLKGFTYAPVRKDEKKKHNCLLPYNELPELEKEKDRNQVEFYPSLLQDINYKVVALSPEQLQNISYIPRHRQLLDESLVKIEIINKTLDEDVFKNRNDKITKEIEVHLSDVISNINSACDSLYEASGIQQNILPSKIYFRICLPDSFILFKPKDILSGDFYFISKIQDSVIFAAADCTGHGTSGALLSMICSNYLDQAVNDNQITDPSDIIFFVYNKLVSFMKRHNKDIYSDHGMEIAICNIKTESRTLLFAGINRPLILFKKNEMEKLSPQRVLTGSSFETILNHIEPSQEVKLDKGDIMYVFSDGYADQLGGPKNITYRTKNFKKLLQEIHSKPLLEQYEILNRTNEQWKIKDRQEATEQTDDILVIGVRI